MNQAQRKLVVIAEDDSSVRTLLTRALGAAYHVETFDNGLDVARRLKRPPMPDLLLCDVMMPGLDGMALARQVKADPQLRGIPIVFLTAKTTSADVIQGIQAGARHYITKPFKLDDLLKKVKTILGQ